MPFFSAVRLGLYIVYELTWSLKTKTFETCALEKILDLVIVTTCKPKYSVLISSRGQTLRTLASYNWTDYFFSVEEELFFSFVFPPIYIFFFWRRCSPQYIFFFLATMFNPSNNKALLASSQFYVTRYNKWTYSVRLITLLVVNFLFLWPFTITAINTFLEGSDFHFTTLENNNCRLLAKIERTCLMSATTPTSRSSQQNLPFAKSYFITLLSVMVYKIRRNQFSLFQAIGKQGSLYNCWGIS